LRGHIGTPKGGSKPTDQRSGRVPAMFSDPVGDRYRLDAEGSASRGHVHGTGTAADDARYLGRDLVGDGLAESRHQRS